MKATDVTGPCTAMKYGLIMLTCGSGKMEFQHDRKPIGWNTELRAVRFGYWKTKTEPSDGFPQTPTLLLLSVNFLNLRERRRQEYECRLCGGPG